MKFSCKNSIIFFLIALFMNFINGANILFLFASGNLSHKVNIWPYVLALAKSGHKLTFISSHKTPHFEHHENISEFTPPKSQSFTKELYDVDRLAHRLKGTKWDLNGPNFRKISTDFCYAFYSDVDHDPDLKNIVETPGKFDLIVINSVFNECGVLLAHQSRTKFILYSSSTVFPWFYGSFGIPLQSSSIPYLNGNFKNYPLNFLDRVREYYSYYLGYSRYEDMTGKLEEIYEKRYGKINEKYIDMERTTSLVFLNTHPSYDFPYALPPLFVSIGGMQCWEPIGKLPKELDDFMNGAEDGVILITFGSTIELSSLDDFYIKIFFNMMRKYSNLRFIWRWKGEAREDSPKNLIGRPWLPQREILNHSKTIGFMTHGGLNSIAEAVSSGIPLIVLPLFADQDYNAIRVKAQETGVIVELTEFSQDVLDNAVHQIYTNKKFKENMMARSRIFKDRPRSPVEEAVFWTEFVLRQNDTSALRPMLLQQSFFTKTAMDVHLAIFFTLLLPPLLIVLLIKKMAIF